MEHNGDQTYLVSMDEHHECITLAGSILFPLQEIGNKLRGIRDQHIMIPAQEM